MSAVEYLIDWMGKNQYFIGNDLLEAVDQAKELESKQLFLASKTSAKEAYKAGQHSMYCGCYEISGCTNYEEWLYKKIKSDDY